MANAVGAGRRWRFITLSVGSIAALWFAGPFGTAIAMDGADRARHFLATSISIQAICLATAWLVRRIRPDIGRWPLILVVALAAAVPGTFVVRASLAVWSRVALDTISIPLLFAQVLFVNLGVLLIAGLLMRAGPSGKASAASSANPLAARLPPHLREARIDTIAAQDHYLEVRTPRGAALVHMTMHEAETLMEAEPGLRVHRSHWVRLGAIEQQVRRNGEQALLLQGGAEVPVSRRRAKALREALRHG
jgi:hypothetical protein